MNTEDHEQGNQGEPVKNILMVVFQLKEQTVAISSKPESGAVHLVVPTSTLVRL